MTCASIMHPNPVTVRDTQTVGEAIEILERNTFRSIPVTDAAGTMLGQFGVHAALRMLVPRIATEPMGIPNLAFVKDDLDDMRRRLRGFWDKPVGDYVDKETYLVHPDTPLTKTVLALYHTHDNIPVVNPETGQLVGIISYWDVVRRLIS
jgi:CBS domain-containing protein